MNWRGRELLLTAIAEAHCLSLAGGQQVRSYTWHLATANGFDPNAGTCDPGTFA